MRLVSRNSPLPPVDLIQPRLAKPFHRDGWLLSRPRHVHEGGAASIAPVGLVTGKFYVATRVTCSLSVA
jgi:hypothetical protein